ncbi:MAG: prepilin-type N-terminal cleavage/methylation domain-containing protein [Candidatus Margulisbacteria bacterium]|nr:prepilin-type N-terminal cleavage/methylation domain-containing protein [Candidatus Margulisiibacteriota bacterium]
MRKGITLLETLIALFISSILFAALFHLTGWSFRESVSTIRDYKNLSRELTAVVQYEKSVLGDSQPSLNIKAVSVNDSVNMLEFKSQSGYKGVIFK